jgi:hypothetical protein
VPSQRCGDVIDTMTAQIAVEHGRIQLGAFDERERLLGRAASPDHLGSHPFQTGGHIE